MGNKLQGKPMTISVLKFTRRNKCFIKTELSVNVDVCVCMQVCVVFQIIQTERMRERDFVLYVIS